MHSSKLIVLFRSLSLEEVRRLGKFVRSPFYNTNKEVSALFDYIRKTHPACNSSKLNKQSIFKKLLPKEAFSDQRIRLLMFRLSDLIEQFLVAQRMKQQSLAYQQLLLAELGERNLYEQFEKKTKEQVEVLAKCTSRDESYFQAQWQFQQNLIFHPQTPRYSITQAGMEKAVRQLDTFYLLSRMRCSGAMLNRQNILAERYDTRLLKQVQEMAISHPVFKKNVVLQIYNDILNLMENNLDEKIFIALKEKFVNNLHLFKTLEQTSLLLYLINCTIQLNNNGKIDFVDHQFELYKLGLKQELFLEKGKLPSSTFLNIVITGTTLGEIEWVDNFILQHSKVIEKNALNMAWTYWHFAKKDFEYANNILLYIESSSLAYSLRIKSLSLRIHYELFLKDRSYYELFVKEYSAFEKYIRRNEQITTNRKMAYLNFISFLKKIGKLIHSNILKDRKRLDQLRAELEQTSSISAKRWLLEKVSPA